MKIFKSVKQSFRKGGNSVFYDKKRLVSKLLILCAVASATLLLYIFDIGCIWRYFFNIRCLGCGMTSAYINVLKGNFVTAFKHHFMYPAVPLLLVYFFFDKELLSKKFHQIVLTVIIIGFIANWILYFLIN